MKSKDLANILLEHPEQEIVTYKIGPMKNAFIVKLIKSNKNNMQHNMKTDDPYYLGNQDCPPTKITFQTGERTITLELPWDAGADDIIQAVYTAMIGMTFHPDCVTDAMEQFVEEHKPLLNENEKDY